MKTFSEAKGDTAVFTFGRFNPPTTGHEKLIDALAKQQGKNAGSLMYVYPSHSQDAKKNPLPHSRKVAYMKKMFRKYAKNIITSKSKNVFDIAVELHNKGHRAVVMVVGSDRVAEFDNLLNKYNGVDGKHGYYGFDDIRVVSAGDRDPDAEGVEGMSASKMRAAAAQGDFDSFKMGLPRNFGDAKKLYDDVRKNMGVREQNWSDEEILRDAYIRGEVWNVGDVVKTKLGEEGTIIRKGTNYVVFENMQRVWLHDLEEEPKKITKTKQAKGEVGDIKGTQPAKYYAKGAQGKEMSVATKKARARHFAKGDSRKPAPGDSAKTKPSQYTKKFKQMYGEKRAKQAVAGGKVQKLVTAHGLKFKGKVYKEIDMELVKIDNSSEMVTFNIIHPKEIFGNEVKIPFKTLRRGPFMATDTSKISEQDKEKAQSDVMKDREQLRDLEVKKRIATLSAKIAQDQEKLAKMQIADKQAKDRNKKEEFDNNVKSGLRPHSFSDMPKKDDKLPINAKKKKKTDERKLSDSEKDKLKKLEKDIDKKDFIDRYGKEEGESIYYATLTKLAKGESIEEKDNPCWDTHKQVGMKKKNGKMVPNCVPKEEVSEGIKMPDYGKQLKRDAIKLGMKINFKPSGYFLLVGKDSDDFKHHQMVAKKLGMKATNYNKTAGGGSRTELEEIEEINVPAIMKSVISRMTHPKGYAKMLQKYIEMVKAGAGKHANRFYAARVAQLFGLNSVFPLVDYINKLVNSGKLPQALMAQYDQNEGYEIGHDFAQHTFKIDPYSAPENESKGYFTRTKSQSSKGKKLVSVVAPDIKKKLKGIDYKIEPDSSGNQIILTVDKSDVEKVKKLVGLPNMVKVVSENYQLDEKIEGLVNKSKQTGVPYNILKKSYDRGMAAWKGGHRPGASQQQWAFARVNSMLTGGKADPDLQKQIKDGGYKKKKKASKESVEEWFSSDETISLYQERYGDEYLIKLNNTYKRMLSKLNEEPCCDDCGNLYDHVISEAEYQGKKVKLNDPIRTSENPKKKFKVYVKNEKGTVVVVRFGDPNMGINRDDPEARKAFRSRHSCDDNPGPKWKARYWSCYQWRAGAEVDN